MQAVWIDVPKTCYSHNGQELGDILGVAPISPAAPSSGGSDKHTIVLFTFVLCHFDPFFVHSQYITQFFLIKT